MQNSLAKFFREHHVTDVLPDNAKVREIAVEKIISLM
jgi:hypothetical protein